jgi:ectoine hydroxylase-related dioxygenase (phytanoyl-CoA dioxygenase family)
MELARFDARSCTQKALNTALDEVGYAIVTDLLPPRELQTLRRELEPHFTARPVSQALFFGFNTTRIDALLSKSAMVREMATHPLLLAAAQHVLGEHCDRFQLNLTQGIRIHPGEKAQILHPDSAMFPIRNKPFEFVLNAIWAYSDFEQENGATLIVPGSHRWPEERQPEKHEITQAAMPAGSVLLYAASLTAHRRRAPASPSAIAWAGSDSRRINISPTLRRSPAPSARSCNA